MSSGHRSDKRQTPRRLRLGEAMSGRLDSAEFAPSDRRVRRRFTFLGGMQKRVDVSAHGRVGGSGRSRLSGPERTQSVELEIATSKPKTTALILFSNFVSLW